VQLQHAAPLNIRYKAKVLARLVSLATFATSLKPLNRVLMECTHPVRALLVQ
jgi:hypothetical protein